MDKFYFAGYLGQRVEELHLYDVFERKDVTLVSENIISIKWRLFEKIFHKFNQPLKLREKDSLFASLWNRFYTLYNIKYSKDDTNYIIFFNSALSVYYTERFFIDLKKKKPNIKLVLYLVDQMDRPYSGKVKRMLPYFDIVYCINHRDTKEYGFNYYPLVYSNYPLNRIVPLKEKSDLYFMGNNWDRDEFIHQIYETLTQKGVKCDFGLLGVAEEKQKHKGKIIYNQGYSMDENLAHSMSTNCILEVMHKTVNATTARYPEAVYLNKKLLTNNKNVVYEKFYNPEYVRIFDKLEDIDIDWLLKKEEIDYHYDGSFSPIELINTVKKDLN